MILLPSRWLVAALLLALAAAPPLSPAHAETVAPITVADDSADPNNPDADAQSDSGDAFSQGAAVKDEPALAKKGAAAKPDSGAAADENSSGQSDQDSDTNANAAPAKPAAPIADFASAVAALNDDDVARKTEAVQFLGAHPDPRAVPVLQAMASDGLFAGPDGKLVYLDAGVYHDAATGAEAAGVKKDQLNEVVVNNRLRGVIQGVLGQLGLFSDDPGARRKAVSAIAGQPSAAAADMLRAAFAKETDPDTKAEMQTTLALIDLQDPDPAKRLASIAELADSNQPATKSSLQHLLETEKDAHVRAAAEKVVSAIQQRLQLIGIAVNLFEGLSLGSILLLAAIGLSITFGVMGVINMAHGEMIMLGAYTAFVVQQAFNAWLPRSWIDGYLVAALPVAFLITALVGIALERGVIRFLYGRPLETLLATWGISLALQQAVRSIFGPDNQAVSNPSWMTGGVPLMGGFTLTWNRTVIIFFCLAVLGALAALLRYSSFGLHMRAVAQNRSMASAMGIRTGRIDALTFAVGSGIAGIAGVALSQIGNVSPNLGQIYIVDSFMVVVFGGVGSLWGTLLGAGSLGIINKLLEPFAGAILGKVFVLVMIILFIQRRPRGLFALRGRSAEN